MYLASLTHCMFQRAMHAAPCLISPLPFILQQFVVYHKKSVRSFVDRYLDCFQIREGKKKRSCYKHPRSYFGYKTFIRYMYCEYFLSVCYLPFCKSILSPKTTSAFLCHFNSIKQKVNVFLLLVVCEKQDFLLMKDKKDIFLYSLIGVVEVLTFTFKSIIHFKYTFVVWGWALGSFFYYPDIQHHLLKKLLLH